MAPLKLEDDVVFGLYRYLKGRDQATSRHIGNMRCEYHAERILWSRWSGGTKGLERTQHVCPDPKTSWNTLGGSGVEYPNDLQSNGSGAGERDSEVLASASRLPPSSTAFPCLHLSIQLSRRSILTQPPFPCLNPVISCHHPFSMLVSCWKRGRSLTPEHPPPT